MVPKARNGRDASSSAETNPMKFPTPPPPVALRQPSNPITSATATPPSTSSIGSSRARTCVIRISALYSRSKVSLARPFSCASSP